MCHPRYGLTHHPGISSNITNATHFSTPPTPPTLALRPLYPHCRTTHVTHADMSPTLTQHHHKHTTNSSRSPTQACHLRYPRLHNQHAISQTPGHPVKDFKCLSSEIPRGNLAVFTFSFYFYSLYLLGLLKHSDRSMENCHRKIQGKLVCLIQNRTIFSKANLNFFRKNCFLILVSSWSLYIF